MKLQISLNITGLLDKIPVSILPSILQADIIAKSAREARFFITYKYPQRSAHLDEPCYGDLNAPPRLPLDLWRDYLYFEFRFFEHPIRCSSKV